jgi:hypothetical protein
MVNGEFSIYQQSIKGCPWDDDMVAFEGIDVIWR